LPLYILPSLCGVLHKHLIGKDNLLASPKNVMGFVARVLALDTKAAQLSPRSKDVYIEPKLTAKAFLGE